MGNFADIEPPEESRFTTSWEDGTEWLLVSNRPRWLVSLFLCVWLVPWSLGFREVGQQLLSGRTEAFLFIWLAVWTTGGLLVLATLLWQFLGRHSVGISAGVLVSRWRILGLSGARRFATNEINDLRVAVNDGRTGDLGWPPFVPSFRSHGGVRFDYGARTVTIMSGLDEAEYAFAVHWIESRLPVYRSR